MDEKINVNKLNVFLEGYIREQKRKLIEKHSIAIKEELEKSVNEYAGTLAARFYTNEMDRSLNFIATSKEVSDV